MAMPELPADDRNPGEIATSEAELRRLEPEVDGHVIEELVRAAYDGLMPAKVHNYVPILIVREVRDIIRGRQAA
jgi:hypothetical protein